MEMKIFEGSGIKRDMLDVGQENAEECKARDFINKTVDSLLREELGLGLESPEELFEKVLKNIKKINDIQFLTDTIGEINLTMCPRDFQISENQRKLLEKKINSALSSRADELSKIRYSNKFLN